MVVITGQVKILQTLVKHTNDVTSVDFAGDCTLVTGSGDKSVRVWEWRQGVGYAEIYYSPLRGHKYGVTAVKVSPQSTMLASSSIDGTTQLWNLRVRRLKYRNQRNVNLSTLQLQSGAKIHTMVQIGGESVRVCKFSPDSTLLVTAGDNGQVCLWDLVRRNLIRCFQHHEGAVHGVSFSPDSNWLVTSCTFGVLKLFSSADLLDRCITDNQAIHFSASVDDAHDLGVICCDFSPVQEVICVEPFTKLYQLVTCGNDHNVKIWNVHVVQEKCEQQPRTASITLNQILEKHGSTLTCTRFSTSGLYLASTSLDKTTIIWDAVSGAVISVLGGHKRYVACCAFSRDGTLLATGSNDKSVKVWNLTDNLSLDSELVRHCNFKLHPTDSDEAEASKEQEVVKHAETNPKEVTLIQELDDHGGAVNSVDFFGNSLIASGSSDKLVRIWKVSGYESPEIRFNEKSFSPLDGHKYSVNFVEFSPCGRMLVSCSLDGTAIIWDTENGGHAKVSLVNSGSGIRVCRWSPDGTSFATAGDDEKTTLWDVGSMKELQVFEGHSDAITAIAFTPDSKYLVTACSEGTWRLFDIKDRKCIGALLICDEGHDLGVQGCDFGPILGTSTITGSRELNSSNKSKFYTLATCGNDSLVKLWHITIFHLDEENEISGENNISYKEHKLLSGHGGNVMNVRFSPIHGEILGSAATDKTARIWSVHSGMCLFVLENHEGLVTTCTFSESTSLFVTGALDKAVLVWKLPQELISQSMLVDNLRHNRRRLADWRTDDVTNWLTNIELTDLIPKIQGTSLTGRHLFLMSETELVARLQLHDEEAEEFKMQLYWLKREDSNLMEALDETEIPHEFVCPITHEIMKEPVLCLDGYTYERAAINEWFLCGKYTSPMTNEPLHDTSFTSNVALRNAICKLLYGEKPSA
ncbi:WD repeat, SAM and U-box domain-containing protein 1 [Orussus abietinus]|uniref:WD repeat, SAM and U-box domain-containing protein 1 n=1 Tax=Orussus abietinus TaxID=222816 RepID=UPI000C715C7B|nr:WD repeat, SAM and U-box domain-containing protein 1 [Orussus abietinus]